MELQSTVGVVLQQLFGRCYNCFWGRVTSAVLLVLQLLLIGVTKYYWGGVTTSVGLMLQLLLGLCYICCWGRNTSAVLLVLQLLLITAVGE